MTNFLTVVFVFIGFFCGAHLLSHQNRPKKAPEYVGVAPAAKPYYDEYKRLAKNEGITFKHDITIGFKRINMGDAIGLTTYGRNWREIDVDSDYWEDATDESKTMVLYHELTHAFCDRGHDYGDGVPYPVSEEARSDQKKKCRKESCITPGYYKDECPLSLLYPAIFDDYCFLIHRDDYLKEMFQRCIPY